MKGMTILEDMVLEQIVGGRAREGGGGEQFLVSNDASGTTMLVSDNAFGGMLTVRDTQETPLTPLGR